jgi:hypothetical protein
VLCFWRNFVFVVFAMASSSNFNKISPKIENMTQGAMLTVEHRTLALDKVAVALPQQMSSRHLERRQLYTDSLGSALQVHRCEQAGARPTLAVQLRRSLCRLTRFDNVRHL